jgi:hypothetical protein
LLLVLNLLVVSHLQSPVVDILARLFWWHYVSATSCTISQTVSLLVRLSNCAPPLWHGALSRGPVLTR